MGAITTEVVDTGEKRDTSGRRVSNAERRREMVEAYRASGLTMAAFARRTDQLRDVHWLGREGRARQSGEGANQVCGGSVAASAARVGHTRGAVADGTVVCGGRVDEVAALVRMLRA